jgi:hypothetical protein
MLDLHLAIQHIVQRLTCGRPVDASLVAQPAELSHAPAPVIRHSEMANLAGTNQIGEPMHRLAQRRRMVLLVQIQEVNVVHRKPPKASLHRIEQMPP